MKTSAAAGLVATGLSRITRAADPQQDSDVSSIGRKKNVLFIIVDDLSNALGCYDHPVVKSPNIDRLAARGVRFEQAYCQYPVCGPSRSSFLTGLRPDSTGVLDNKGTLHANLPDVVTLPLLFRQHGYFTARIGKIYNRQDNSEPAEWDAMPGVPGTTPLGKKGEGRNLTNGRLAWCRWRAAEGEDEDQPDGQLALEAIRLLEQNHHKPFFLALGFVRPHDPFVAPKRYFNLYPLEHLNLPEEPADRSPVIPVAMSSAFDSFTDQERREFMRAYYAGVSFTDAQVGKVIDALDRLKLSDNTIIVLIGDNGYHLGEHGWWNKNTLFEPSARVPLIVVTPDMKIEGENCSRIVEFVDIYPTLAELCGLSTPSNLQGKSLRPLLKDVNFPWEEVAFTQIRHGKIVGRSVRTKRWRYTEWNDGERGVELYDHDDDPGEYYNLALVPKYANMVAELKELLHSQAGTESK